jgi:hypothetical protein
MKSTMSNIGKQESQNDYMHTHRRKKSIRAKPQLDTNFLAVTRKNASNCLQQTSNRIVQ